MICKKCGAEVPDEMTFCTVCGEPMEQPKSTKPLKEKLFTGKKKYFVFGGIILGVILIVVLLILIFSGNGAVKRVEELYKSVVSYDANAVLDVLPPVVQTHYKEKLTLEDSKLEIISTQTLKDFRIEKLDRLYGETYGTDPGYIEDAVLVEVDLVYHGENLSRDPVPLYMVKVEGNWYLDVLMTSDELDEAEWEDISLPDILK